MPQPSSTTVEDGVRRAWSQRGLEWRAEIHSAKRGVIFQRTVIRSEGFWVRRG
jgi:hypothetical protein